MTNVGPAAVVFVLGLVLAARTPDLAFAFATFCACTLLAAIFFALRFNTAFRYSVTLTPDLIQVRYGRKCSEIRIDEVVGRRNMSGYGMNGIVTRLVGANDRSVEITSDIGRPPELMQWIEKLDDLDARDSIWNCKM